MHSLVARRTIAQAGLGALARELTVPRPRGRVLSVMSGVIPPARTQQGAASFRALGAFGFAPAQSALHVSAQVRKLAGSQTRKAVKLHSQTWQRKRMYVTLRPACLECLDLHRRTLQRADGDGPHALPFDIAAR